MNLYYIPWFVKFVTYDINITNTFVKFMCFLHMQAELYVWLFYVIKPIVYNE